MWSLSFASRPLGKKLRLLLGKRSYVAAPIGRLQTKQKLQVLHGILSAGFSVQCDTDNWSHMADNITSVGQQITWAVATCTMSCDINVSRQIAHYTLCKRGIRFSFTSFRNCFYPPGVATS